MLPDGREAVIKLQRPDIRERMTTDLRIMQRLARTLQRTKLGKSANLTGVVSDLHVNTFKELNPALEAHRQTLFRDRIGAFGDNSFITAPEVYWEYCGPHMICMERMSGVPMDEFDTIRDRGCRRRARAATRCEGVDGSGDDPRPFHGDVHAGNLWVLDDGRATYLDFGIMGELTDEWKDLICDLFYTSMIDGDFSRIARAFKRVGAFPEDIGTDERGRSAHADGVRADARRGHLEREPRRRVQVDRADDGAVRRAEPARADVGHEATALLRALREGARAEWALARDVFLVKNIFPEEAAKKAADLGIDFPD